MNNSKKDSIKKEFDEIVKLCEERIPEYGERASYFLEPATEEEILEWEKITDVRIPETYREWLKLTKTCQMCQTVASFIFPQTEQPKFIPKEYVVIGYVVGDGEVMCFSKSEGKFITYFEGKVNEEYDDFVEVLAETKRMIKGEHTISMEEKMLMLEKLKEIRRKRGEIE